MKKKVKEILGTSLYLLGVLVATFLIVTYVGQRTKVSGGSMEPMLSDGDNLIIDKISYRFQDPQRFDIVVFPFQYANRPYYIKRIIGLPGETIYIDDDGNIYINNEILNESYGKEVITDPGRAYEPITLGEDEYFVMGDNRNNSSDSRDPVVGNIQRDDLIGKAWVRIWPFDKMGMIKHQ
ncbi:MAG: signal peptidase I [Lachnospiraceae bacterium]|nr:signal peptidase I [Lachnospiraceae bacterium]